MSNLLTIITPTYNRSSELKKLFESLQNQTCFDFEWLIVDDGSTDDTKDIVSKFSESAKFQIKYLYKNNGGKHTALNAGVKDIHTELTFIVDSDDTLIPECIETIRIYYNKYKCCGVGVLSFLKKSGKNGIILKMPYDEFVGSYVQDRVKIDRPGDMAEVFWTIALKEFPFPEFKEERFLSEDVVWIPLGLKYKTAFINKPIYCFDYLPDGLTNNDKVYKFASPCGSMMRGKVLMTKACGVKANVKGAIIYNCYKCEIKNDEIPNCLKLDKVRDKLLVCLTFFVGKLYNKKWKTKI